MHELHIWQLSETKLIATVHIRVEKQAGYMAIATLIRKLLHRHGIHSTTIQPEFVTDDPGSNNMTKVTRASFGVESEVSHGGYEANEVVC